MGYLDGVSEEIAVQNAIDRRRVVIGEDKIFTDKGTVKSAQIALQALARKTGNHAFDPIEIDGKIGPHTRAAVAAFNREYGWPDDGGNITEGTFVAMQRPDVMDPPAHADAPPPPPLPPTPKQVDRMVAPVVSAPTPAPASPPVTDFASALTAAVPELSRTPSVFQRAKPRETFTETSGKLLEYPPGHGDSSTTKWIFIGVAGVAGLGVLWLLADAVRGRRSSRGGSASRHTLVGHRRS